MYDLVSLISNVADEMNDGLLDSSTDGSFTRANVVRTINRVASDIIETAANTSKEAIRKTTDISFVADQEAYTLPESFRSAIRVERPDLDSTYPPRLDPVDSVDQLRSRGPRHMSDYARFTVDGAVGIYAIRNSGPSEILVRPIPAGAISNALRVHYIPQHVEMHYGTAQAGASTTITLASTATAGDIILRDDAYNGTRIQITSGTGAGQIRNISDYAASTKVATVDSAWDTNPDDTSVYSILPQVERQSFKNALVWGTVWRLSRQDELLDNESIDRRRIEYENAKNMMVDDLSRLQRNEPRRVRQTLFGGL